MSCLDENQVLDLVQGKLAFDARGAIEEHLDGCDGCRQLLAKFVRLYPEAAATLSPSLTHSGLATGEPAAPPPLLRNGQLVGRYVVLHPLGAGGMGVVYAAYDPELDRKVAVKLWRSSGASQDELLASEARAMAKLTHPNVVAVYDVGRFQDQLFFAMEHVEGRTLRHWLLEQSRGWREVVRAFCLAGRGLAAAHASGLAHLDFKSQNVLVTTSGRVAVTDFGLARAAGGPAQVAGTPGYAAPEVLRGEAADVRSDQFSFCVALVEALTGTRPGGPSTASPSREAGETLPSRAPGMPNRVRRLVERGLAENPDQRHASMLALVDALEKASGRRWGALAGAAALAVVASTGAFLANRTPPCPLRAELLTDVWDGSTKAKVHARLSSALPEGTSDAANGTQRALDDYATALLEHEQRSCLASRVEKSQSEELHALRGLCLDQRRLELSALVQELLIADADAAKRSPEAALALPAVAACAKAREVALDFAGDAQAEDRPRTRALREQLAAARARFRLGKSKDAEAAARKLAKELEGPRLATLRAENQMLLAELRSLQLDWPGANAEAELGLLAAETARNPRLALQLWTMQSAAFARLGNLDAARLAQRHALAVMDSLDDAEEALVVSAALINLSYAASAERDYAKAETLADRAVALRLRAYGEDDPRTGLAYRRLALALAPQKKNERAIEASQKAHRVLKAALGDSHPETMQALQALGIALFDAQRRDEGLAVLEETLAITRREFGTTHPRVLGQECLVASALVGNGQAEAGLARARTAREKLPKDTQAELVARCETTVAQALLELGRPAEALPVLLGVTEAREKRTGPNHPDLMTSLTLVGQALLDLDAPKKALPPLERAAAIGDRAEGLDAARRIGAKTRLGAARLLLGQQKHALEVLEQAAKLLESNNPGPIEAGSTRYWLARALGQGNPRSLELLERAHRDFEAAGEAGRPHLEKLTRWRQTAPTR